MGQADWAQKREDLRFFVTLSVTAICGPTRCTGSFQKILLTLMGQRKQRVAALLRECTGGPVTCGCCIRHRFHGQGRAGPGRAGLGWARPGLTDVPAKPAGPLPSHRAVAPPVAAARGRRSPAPGACRGEQVSMPGQVASRTGVRELPWGAGGSGMRGRLLPSERVAPGWWMAEEETNGRPRLAWLECVNGPGCRAPSSLRRCGLGREEECSALDSDAALWPRGRKEGGRFPSSGSR